ncbi:DoxX family protein [Crossiella cryophila]|uniref:Putative membrane protein YphA (DoxX/SURF4 family) n=1 Tax=Crossiella cryophila TaxID=43355 RepID=A0A7W7C8N7_9PSEU|nr:DoxX family protein [Crossiella cryophila]MBB4675333.1 putative membrane protein YphA (DoxX/SURF4 family) [Crossiella cryophila]
MNTVLWILQIVLAAAMLGAGAAKLSQGRDKLLDKMTWAESYSDPAFRGIGAVEVLGALGLILPAVTGIAPVLVPLAATGLAITMLGAVLTHVRRKEFGQLAPAAVFLVLAVVIAWGRFGPYPL